MTQPARDARLGVGAILMAISLTLVAAGIAGAGPRASGTGAAELLPDITIRPITHLAITKSKGLKVLRFSTVVANQGAGVLEMFPVADDCDGDGDVEDDRSAFQQVYVDTNGSGVYEPGTDTAGPTRFAGCSFFHPAHDHWHFEEFARYLLTRPVTGKVLAQAEKVSFCIRDSIWFDSTLPGSPSVPAYGNCSQSSTSGLSIGWADNYASYLSGQELDVRGLPDHRYCLRLTADPGARVDESDETNNERTGLIRIRGKRVLDLDRACREG